MARRARLFGRREEARPRPRLEVVTEFYDELRADPSAVPDEPAEVASEEPDEAPLALEAAPELEAEEETGEDATGANPFGDPGVMDEDGFSAELSYAEKAEVERRHLRTIEQRLAAAKAALDLNTADAMAAYAEDIRQRIARFEALMREPDPGAP